MNAKKPNHSFVNLENARQASQREVMEKIKNDGICSFCSEHLLNYHTKPVLKDGQFWIVTENAYPYPNTQYHWLLISKSHTEKLSDLNPLAGEEFITFVQWLENEHSIESGAFAMRFGDIRYNGASVRHLHAHVIVGDVHNPNHEKVRFKMSVPANNID